MKILVGLGTCGIAAGAEDTFRALGEKVAAAGIKAEVVKTGCAGLCYREADVELRLSRRRALPVRRGHPGQGRPPARRARQEGE